MTRDDFWNKISTLILICDVNQRYHQKTAWIWKACDRTAKILVAVMAVAAFCLTIAHGGVAIRVLELIFGAVAVLAAIALNVIPFGEYEKTSDEMFHSWSDLRKDAEIQSLKLSNVADVSECMIERLEELTAKQHSLNAIEPAPNRKRLQKCQEDHNQQQWGVRDNEAAEKVKSERRAHEVNEIAASRASISPSSLAVAEAVDRV